MISIILPTYNRKHLIEGAIRSVLDQTYQDFELIIVDDCSTDNTEAFLKENFSDSRIRYIRNEKNLGAGGSRNQGIGLAQGEWIAFIDSDTIWYPNKLERQLELCKEHPEAGMIYTAFYKESPEARAKFPFEEIPEEHLSGDLFGILMVLPLVDTPTMLVAAEVFRRVGVFESSLRGLEDYELSLRIAKAYPVYCCTEPLMVSYCTPGCVSENILACLEARFFILREFREDYEQYDMYKDKLDELLEMCTDAGLLNEYTHYLKEYLL